MCGIVGQCRLGASSPPVDVGLVRDMASAIRHRGPDEDGFYSDVDVALGMRRLSVIDLSTGTQPIANEDESIWVVFNGEIFNFAELRSRLKSRGHVLRTNTDTEVLVHLYEEHGERLVDHLIGMFAFAVWDTRSRTLLLARDQIGVKPLYYTTQGGVLTFASEMKALLLAPSVDPEVSPQAIDMYLTLRFVPSPMTLLEDVHKLPPGHLMTVSRGGTTLRQYWDIPGRMPDPPAFTEAGEVLSSLLQDSVERQLASDVPLGVLLSGGIDSSSIVGYMHQSGRRDIKTFTVGFEGAHDLNEFDEARLIARRFGTDHHEFVVDTEDYLAFLPKFVWHLDEPVGDFSAVAFYYIARTAREHVTVALSGQGSDELFAGYDRYVAERFGATYRAIPAAVRERLITPSVARLPRLRNAKRATRSLGVGDPLLRYLRINEVFTDAMKSDLYSTSLVEEVGESDPYGFLADAATRAHPSLGPLALAQYLDMKYWLADYLLLYTDKLSMANSLEARVPLLDHRVVELAFGLPDNYKLRGLERKAIFKQAVRQVIPHETINRRKRGFIPPVEKWLRESMGDYLRQVLLDPSAQRRGLYDAAGLERFIHAHSAGRENHGRHLFCLLLLELWHQEIIDPHRTRAKTVPAQIAL